MKGVSFIALWVTGVNLMLAKENVNLRKDDILSNYVYDYEDFGTKKKAEAASNGVFPKNYAQSPSEKLRDGNIISKNKRGIEEIFITESEDDYLEDLSSQIKPLVSSTTTTKNSCTKTSLFPKKIKIKNPSLNLSTRSCKTVYVPYLYDCLDNDDTLSVPINLPDEFAKKSRPSFARRKLMTVDDFISFNDLTQSFVNNKYPSKTLQRRTESDYMEEPDLSDGTEKKIHRKVKTNRNMMAPIRSHEDDYTYDEVAPDETKKFVTNKIKKVNEDYCRCKCTPNLYGMQVDTSHPVLGENTADFSSQEQENNELDAFEDTPKIKRPIPALVNRKYVSENIKRRPRDEIFNTWNRKMTSQGDNAKKCPIPDDDTEEMDKNADYAEKGSNDDKKIRVKRRLHGVAKIKNKIPPVIGKNNFESPDHKLTKKDTENELDLEAVKEEPIKLEKRVDYHFARKIVEEVMSKVNQNANLRIKIGNALNKKRIYEVEDKDNCRNTSYESPNVLDSVSSVLDKLVTERVEQMTCQRLPTHLRRYLKRILNPPRRNPENNHEHAYYQDTFLFHATTKQECADEEDVKPPLESKENLGNDIFGATEKHLQNEKALGELEVRRRDAGIGKTNGKYEKLENAVGEVKAKRKNEEKIGRLFGRSTW